MVARTFYGNANYPNTEGRKWISRIWQTIITPLVLPGVRGNPGAYSEPDITGTVINSTWLPSRILMILSITVLSLSAIDFSYLICYVTLCFKLTCDGTTTRLLSGIYCLEGITSTTPDNNDTYRPQLPNLWERTPSYAPTPGYLDREYTPSVIYPSPDPEQIDDKRLSRVHRSQSDQLGFLPVVKRENKGI